jgi:hypothetical protein
MIPDDETFEALKRKTASMTVEERVNYCLELGRQEIQAYALANGVTEDEARQRWRLRSQFGRRFSRCKAG